MTETVKTTATLLSDWGDGQAAHYSSRERVRDIIASLDITRRAVVNVRDAPYNAKGDGSTDDAAAFNAAFAAGAGKTVLIPPANPGQFYRITDKITVLSNTWVEGSGISGEVRQQTTEMQTFYASGATNIRFTKVAAYGRPGEYTNWTTIAHLGRGIDLVDCSDIRITECTLRNFALAAIFTAGCSEVRQYRNKIQGTHSNGAPINGIGERQFGICNTTSALNPIPTDIEAVGNDIQGVVHGINITTCDRVWVHRNNCHDIPGEHAYYLGASHLIVSKNIAADFRDDGIKIYFGTVGAQRDVQVIGNTCYSNRSTGHGVDAGYAAGGSLEDVLIALNNIRNTSVTPTVNGLARGINVSGTDIEVLNNKIKDPYQHGIMNDATLASIDLTIDGNKIKGQQQYAILAQALLHTRLRITNNKIATGIAGFQAINVGAGDDIVVDLNKVTGAWSYALHVAATTTNVRVRGNKFSGWGSAPVLLDGGGIIAVYAANDDGKEVTSYAAAVTVDVWDRIIKVNSNGAGRAVNLPSAVGRNGREIVVIKIDAGAFNVTLTPNGAETISGAANLPLTAQWNKATIVSDGTNWLQVA